MHEFSFVHKLGLSNVCQHYYLLRIGYLKRIEFTKEKEKKGCISKREELPKDQFHAANERLSMRAPFFSFLGRTRRRNFWLFLLVPIMFLICSHEVPKGLPEFRSCSPKHSQ